MESRWLRAGLRVWVALVLAFLFIPIVLIVLYAFNSSNIESWPIPGFSLHWFSVAWHDSQVRSRVLAVGTGRADRDRAGRAARFGGRVRAAHLRVLRPGGDLVPAGAAAGAARHHHRDRAELVLLLHRDPARHGHDRHRAHHVLHRGGVQQLDRPAAPDARLAGRGVAGPGRPGVADAALRHAAADRDRADLRRAAGLRPVLQRGHRDRVHRGRAEHAAAVDLRRDPARPATARGERGRLGRHPAHADPGDPRRPGGGGRRDQPVSPRRRRRRGRRTGAVRVGLRRVSRCRPSRPRGRSGRAGTRPWPGRSGARRRSPRAAAGTATRPRGAG